MSTPMSSPFQPAEASHGGFYYDPDDTHGQGLVTFAGVLIAIAAVLNTLYGIAAIDKAHFFTNNAKFVFADLATFGWIVLALGIVQFFAAAAIWQGASWARWFGVACACCNMILQMLWIPAAPVLALTILAMDLIAVYGLLAYGGRRKAANAMKERAAA